MKKEVELLEITHIPEPLKIWEKIEIYTGEGADKGTYLSRIESFKENEIIIAPPDFIEGNTLLRNDVEILVWVTKKDAVYQFASKITSHQNGSSKVYLLSTPMHIQRIQRREFVRINYSAPVSYALISENSTKESIVWQQSLINDLSGSGMMLETIPDVSVGRYMLVKSNVFAAIGISDPLVACCSRSETINNGHFSGINIIRTDSDAYKKIPNFHIPIANNNFNFSMQERLVSFVFHQQVEIRKKGVE